MLKRSVALLVAACAIGLSGCKTCPVSEDEFNGIKDRLSEYVQENGKLKTRLQDADSAVIAADAKVKALQAEVDKYSALNKRLQEIKDAQDADLQKLKGIVADLDWLANIGERDGQNFLVMDNAILFAAGSHELKDEAKKGLDVIAKRLAEVPDAKIRIDGHTDGQPIRASADRYSSNWNLAAERAESVRAYLAQKGVPEKRMFIAAYGPNVPQVEPENPTADVAENRRVEILLIFDKGDAMKELLEGM